MIVSLVYMALGVMIGFLIKHELDIKSRKKRAEKRLKSVANIDTSCYDETLRNVRELNNRLVIFQKKKEAQ